MCIAFQLDMLVLSLDGNQDRVVSAREFRNWLFPHNMSAALAAGSGAAGSGAAEGAEEVMAILLRLLQEKFQDDPVSFFEAIDT
jgi:hypothetical protein